MSLGAIGSSIAGIEIDVGRPVCMVDTRTVAFSEYQFEYAASRPYRVDCDSSIWVRSCYLAANASPRDDF